MSKLDVEAVKRASGGLRGSIPEELASPVNHFGEEAIALLKFHGVYQQDDRDARKGARESGAGRDFSCMIRTKSPGGYLPADFYLAVDRLTELIRELEPQLIFTHAASDPFNPDHAGAHDATVQARQLASGAGVASAFKTIAPPELLLFEPHQPELCSFVPTTFLDITPVWGQKVAAMEAMGAQSYLRQYYSERAEHRANHARRISGRSDIRYAEAFQRELPVVVDAL